MMRVAYVCLDPGVPIFGRKGCSIHVQAVLREFVSRGYDVEVFTAGRALPPPDELRRVRVHTLLQSRARDLVRREQQLMAVNEDLADWLARSATPDLIYERHALFSDSAMRLAEARGIPAVLEVNAPLLREQQQHRKLHHPEAAADGVRRAFRAAGCVIAVSGEIADYVHQVVPERSGVHVVPNGVDVRRFTPMPACRPGDGRFRIGFVGTLKPWHGVAELVDAFSGLDTTDRSSLLTIAGDGPEALSLKQQVRCAGLSDRVEFTGALDHACVPQVLAALDVAVAPYPPAGSFYFSPLKIYEYLATGSAIVASDQPAFAGLLQHETNALLYPPGDTGALRHALQRLQGDSHLCARLGQEARRTAVLNHQWASRVDTILACAAAAGGRHTGRPQGVA